ncbi:MAG: integrase core domain-containing protein [Pseudomonadota bacterium]
MRGWQLSRSGKATTAAALEQALISRFGTLGRRREPFLLRWDNGLVFTSRNDTRLRPAPALHHPALPVAKRHDRARDPRPERAMRPPAPLPAMRVIGDWISFYNHRRPHQALGMKTPAEAYA